VESVHATELIDAASEIRNINVKMAIAEVPPLVNFGNNTWALDYWDNV
jgi:hypothetical protein